MLHPFAGASRSRRRARFIPTPASAGRASRTSSQSGRRVRQQRPVCNHQRLSALSDLRKTIPRKAATPLNPHRRPTAHRFPAGSFFGGFRTPALYPVDRSPGPASETLHDSGHSPRLRNPLASTLSRFSPQPGTPTARPDRSVKRFTLKCHVNCYSADRSSRPTNLRERDCRESTERCHNHGALHSWL